MKKFILVVLLIGLAIPLYAAGPVANPPTTDIGKEIVAISQHLQGMAGDFSKSQIGQMTSFALAWKFIYKPIMVVIIGIIILVAGNILVLIQWNKQWPKICEDEILQNPGIILIFTTIGINFAGIMMLV
jgi:hypothetical protein